MNWFNVNLQTFSWSDTIWVFKCPYCFLSYSQRLQVYWTFSWTVSLWVFKIPYVVALYSHRLHGYTQLLPVLIQYESFHNHVKKKSRSTSTLPSLRGDMVHQIRPGNQSAFAFMTINNSTTLPTLTSCSRPYFSPYNHHYCSNTDFEYFCYKSDKVFMETIQSELHVRKISIKYT